MSTNLFPLFYVLIVTGSWILTSVGIKVYYDRKIQRRMIQDKVRVWNSK